MSKEERKTEPKEPFWKAATKGKGKNSPAPWKGRKAGLKKGWV